MASKKFTQHRGPIPLARISEGINAALDNAARLAEDEESGKVAILRQMVLCDDDAEWRQAWKDYRSHTKKNITWIFGELVRAGARNFDALKKIADPESDHPKYSMT